MDLLKMVKDEWAVVSTTPLTFLILAALMFATAYFFARWRYTAIIDQVNASKDALTERLHLRSEQTEAFREKASKFDNMLTEVVDSGADELKDRTLKLVADIREFIGRFQRLDSARQDDQFFGPRGDDSDIRRDLEWEKQTRALINNSLERSAEYERRFKTDSIILRDELRSRLPNHKPVDGFGNAYEHPTNFFGYNFVANDLEQMAKQL